MKQCKCYHLLQFIHRFLSRKCKYASLLPPVLFSRTRKYRASWCPFVPCSIDFLYYTVNVKHTGDLIRGWPSFLRTCLNILDPPTLQQKSACAHKLFGLSIPSATMVPQLTSMQEKTESPQILNSALLHQCTGLESIGSTGSLWLSKQQDLQHVCKMLPSVTGADGPSSQASFAQKWKYIGNTGPQQWQKKIVRHRWEMQETLVVGLGVVRDGGEGALLEWRWKRNEWVTSKRMC